ncbi:MAG TPA: zinc ABC transporter substrate-binding protein [Bdellovibrionota bacterium]|jgi:manganese/zinc/iron transport system substrate-binding protein|nr:zinc ABC transporter substrate-binding protein [Bdellovibrionota bacterium]
MPNKKHLAVFLWVLFFGMLGCSRGGKESSSSEKVSKKLRILATTTIVEDMIRQSLGDLVDVEVLMGPGTDPHLYVASPRDYAKVKGASVVVYSGLHLEAKLGDLLNSLSRSKEVIELSSFLPKGRVIVDSLRVPDPHFWFDPELWLTAGEGFAKRMQHILPAHKATIRDNFSRWRRAVNESTNFARDQFAKIPPERRVLVTSHDAFRYFGRFFDIEVMSVLGVSTDAQISIKKIENLVKDIKKRSVPAVFLETSVSPYAIQRIQEESGAKIGGELYGDSLGGPDTVASTYVGMLKHNAQIVVEGLTHEN